MFSPPSLADVAYGLETRDSAVSYAQNSGWARDHATPTNPRYTDQSTHAPAPILETSTEKKNILIVDDEAPMQMLASTIVSKLGYGSTTASSSEEAVKAFEEASKNGKPFEAVVMELARPSGMSGLEATVAIKQIDAEAIHS